MQNSGDKQPDQHLEPEVVPAPELAARTPERQWLHLLRELRAGVYGRPDSLAAHCLAASEALDVAPQQDPLRRTMHETLPEPLRHPWGHPWGHSGSSPGSSPGAPPTLTLLEAMAMVLTPVERLTRTRGHLLDHLSPVPPLLQRLLEQHGMDATLHRYDVDRLVRLVAALPDWLARRGSAPAAVALLEALEQRSLSDQLRLPLAQLPGRDGSLRAGPEGPPRREALDTALEIEAAGLIEAGEAADDVELSDPLDATVLVPVEADEDDEAEDISLVSILAMATEESPTEALQSVEMLTTALEEVPTPSRPARASAGSAHAPAPVPEEADEPLTAVDPSWQDEPNPGEVLVSHGLEWYGHRHDGLPVPASAWVLKGGVVQTLPAFSARFPLAREDVLVAVTPSAESSSTVLLPLLRLLPVWAELRVYLKS